MLLTSVHDDAMNIEQAPPQTVPFSSLHAGQPFTNGPPSTTSNVLLRTAINAGTSGEAVQLSDGAPLSFPADAQVWPSNAKVVQQL